MKPTIPLAVALALLVSGCVERDPARESAPLAPAAAADDLAAPPPLDQPVAEVPPATAADLPTTPGTMPAEGAIDFAGFGPTAFGADAEQVRMAWGRDLQAMPEPDEPGGCHYLMPALEPGEGYRIAFMIEGGRFVRIDVRDPAVGAPGGGRAGMDAEQIQTLYHGRVDTRPHKYVDGGSYLRVADASDGDGVLVFETDAAGRVAEWRVGLPPQVDYVEGCS